MQNYSSLLFLLKISLHQQHSSLKYCKILLHYFCSWKSQQHSSISWTFFLMLQIFNQSLKSLQETSSHIWSTRTFSLLEISACNLVDLHFHSVTYLKNLKNLSTISVQRTSRNWRTHHCHYHAYKYSRFLVYCQYQYRDPTDIETWDCKAVNNDQAALFAWNMYADIWRGVGYRGIWSGLLCKYTLSWCYYTCVSLILFKEQIKEDNQIFLVSVKSIN